MEMVNWSRKSLLTLWTQTHTWIWMYVFQQGCNLIMVISPALQMFRDTAVINLSAEEPNGEEIEATLDQLSDEEKEEACGNGWLGNIWSSYCKLLKGDRPDNDLR